MTVADRVRRLIEDKGWTQDQAAVEMGVSRFSINQILNGRRTLTAWMAVKLETVFETTAEGLLKQQVGEDLEDARAELHGWITHYNKNQKRRRP